MKILTSTLSIGEFNWIVYISPLLNDTHNVCISDNTCKPIIILFNDDGKEWNSLIECTSFYWYL